MSEPRQVVAGSTYLITRRTILRHMLLRPDRAMTRALRYLLATYARRYGLEVHAFCAMSTHIHLVVTDVRGNLPFFLHAFHRAVALCTKALRKWPDVVWDKSPSSVVHLMTHAAIVEKIAYVLANPVAAGLVRRAAEWPGATVLVSQIGRGSVGAPRPEVYLDPENPHWDAQAEIAITLPPGVEAAEASSFRRQVQVELARLEAEAHAAMAREGRAFLGADRAVAVSPDARATSEEPTLARNPTFAVGRGQSAVRRTATAALRDFRASYHAALARWREGKRRVAFPQGTWWLAVFHGVTVVQPGLAP